MTVHYEYKKKKKYFLINVLLKFGLLSINMHLDGINYVDMTLSSSQSSSSGGYPVNGYE